MSHKETNAIDQKHGDLYFVAAKQLTNPLSTATFKYKILFMDLRI